ncbi:MarR family transcriptional regulator [Krasilnikovia sp. MM14-A1259]|uniref:MarR family transcriptional regulator n=1 Tax=Krasilnikovia sp. MM14-A1259 TaxID=3373539 RepID=UPI003805B3B0
MSAATPTATAIARTLIAHRDGITTRDLAAAARVGASTAAKVLVAMEIDGTATRTPGATNGTRKVADIWCPTATTVADEETDMPADTITTHDAPTTDAAPTDDAAVTSDATGTDEPGDRSDAAGTDEPGDPSEAAGTDEPGNASDAAGSALAEAPVSAVPVSGAPVSGAPSGSADHFKIVMVAGILGDHPDGVTAADVAEQSGLRGPVVARALTAMEVAGAAARRPGGSDDAPELWVRGEADLSTVDIANAAPYRECVCTCGHRHRVRTGATVTTRRAGRTTGEVNADGTPTLGKNGLRNQVEAFMRDLGPGHEVTPGTVGRELGGRSSGACLNALGRLSAAGVVVLTSEAPVKYSLADTAPAPSEEVATLMTRPVISDDAPDAQTDNAADASADDEVRAA